VLREITNLVEPGKALFEMLQGVIAAVRLAIAGDQLFVQRAIG
jgi:hypothetical protein